LSTIFEQITPLILTYNEAPNIGRTLDRLSWAQRIVVIDSGSTDETLNILRAYPNVDVIHRPFTEFAGQCNFGLSQIRTPWVLSIDADYELSDELISELCLLSPSDSADGYRARFVYRIWGRPLRGALYPPRTVLYRHSKALYANEGHGHRVTVDGKVLALRNVIYHDDRKSLARWISSQQRYAREEANHLLESSKGKFSKFDKIRAIGWPAPFIAFVYTLFAKGCILDGWPGWHYALQRLVFEALTALELADRRLRTTKEN
jgi:glycosyltransferase involved in cell wall biosynthesis